MLKNILLVGLGGFVGSISRYLVYITLEEKSGGLPFATFTVNMIGSLILGAFIGYFLTKGYESNTLRLLFAIGFCGSFTTFSTFALENYQFIEDKNFFHFATYGIGSLAAGLLMVVIGLWIGKAL